jgi:hypothetical protein
MELVVNATPQMLYSRIKTWYPLYTKLGKSQGRSGKVWKMSPLNGIQFSDLPAHSKLLYQLCNPSPFINQNISYKIKYKIPSPNAVSSTAVFGFNHSFWVFKEKFGGFCMKRFTLTGGMTAMTLRTSFLYSSLAM